MLTPDHEQALAFLSARLDQLDASAYVDALVTLDGPQWAEVRALALTTLASLTPMAGSTIDQSADE